MNEFELQYSIENKYENTVRRANFQLLVIPESGKDQKVHDLKFSCSANHEIHISKNIFGFKTIQYYIDKPFSEFWFKLSAKIERPELNPFCLSPWSPLAEYEEINLSEFYINNYLFLSSTDLTKLPSTADFEFPSYSRDIQVFDFLINLNSYIFGLLTYAPESTNINTQIGEVLQHKKGVCQDYAHLFISVCRKNKIPARYVSGYLNQGDDFIGSSQMHAWAEALIPGLGWVGFDSTNNLLADHHYMKIAHGTDFRDCSPIIGILESTGTQQSIHSVTITNQ
jgi:transglutaminase-like putative cysteine protease